ncbi:MAG: GDP-mannose 4,6-dehydratase [Candidatus Ranarchaeia archaeon]
MENVLKITLDKIISMLTEDEQQHFKNTHCVVAGGAGFIGSWLSEALLELGASITIIDNLSTSDRSFVDLLLSRKSDAKQTVHFRNQSVEALDYRGARPDYIFHLASPASPRWFETLSLEIIKTNTLGTLNLLDLAKKYDSSFIYTSTSEVYGNPHVVPTSETYFGNVNPIGWRSPYDEGKRAGEAIIMAHERRHGTDIRIARLFNTSGPRMSYDDGRVIPTFVCQVLRGEALTVYGRGNQTRSFSYVSDIVAGLIKMACRDACKGEIINLGSKNEISILDLAKKILSIINDPKLKIVFKPMPEDDPSRRCPDITKAKKILNWEPVTPLEETLELTIEYFKDKILAKAF